MLKSKNIGVSEWAMFFLGSDVIGDIFCGNDLGHGFSYFSEKCVEIIRILKNIQHHGFCFRGKNA